MALGQKACRPAWVILREDPSVLPVSDYRAYAEGGFADRSMLVLDPLQPPTEFLLRPLTDAQKDTVDMATSGRVQKKVMVQCSLLEIRNYEREDEYGVIVRDHRPRRVNHQRLGEIIEDGWMEQFNFRSDLLDALGAAIVIISEARRPLPRPSSTPSDSAGSSATPGNTDT